jgi:hypothetical protein
MNKRKLLIGLLVAGLFTAGLGAGVFPASADQRTYKVTFVGGTSTVVTLDVPAGTPVDQVTIPGIALPVLSIEDITPASTTPAPSSTPTPAATPTTETPSEAPQADAEPVGGGQHEQKVTGHKKRQAEAEV